MDHWLNDAVNDTFSVPIETLADAAFNVVYDHTKQIMGTMYY